MMNAHYDKYAIRRIDKLCVMCIQRTILEGRIEGRRGRGRQILSFMDQGKEKVNLM